MEIQNIERNVLLSFSLRELKGTLVEVRLISISGKNSHLEIEGPNGCRKIEWKDLLGAVAEGQNRLRIVSFPRRVRKRMFSSTENRFQEEYIFEVDNNVKSSIKSQDGEGKKEGYSISVLLRESNMDDPISFLKDLQNIIREFAQNDSSQQFEERVQRKAAQREFLLFLNPSSGKGEAALVFSRVSELFEKIGLQYHVIETLYKMHCFQYIQELTADKLLSYHGIMCISGDGTIHEIINGLLSRDDAESVRHIPIGAIHGGSGNALQTSICKASGECNTPECAAFMILKNKTIPIDIIELTRNRTEEEIKDVTIPYMQRSAKIYSFLSISWAFISDIDLGSEFLRFLGQLRFELYGYWRLLFLKKYSAILNYSSELPNENKLDQAVEFFPPKETLKLAPLSSQDSSSSTNTTSRQFSLFSLSNVAWISEKFEPFPLASFSDGLFDLIYLTADQGKMQMLKAVLGLENGSYFDRKKQSIAKGYQVKYAKIRTIQLDPAPGDSGYLAIDGEKYKVEPFSGKVLPSFIRVFSF